jgi:hypothetical protein
MRPYRSPAPILLLALAMAMPVHAENWPTISAQKLPSPLQALWARDRPELGPYGHCATAFDSQIDGSKMAWSCAIYVRLSAQGERLAMKLCGERVALLKVKDTCKLVVEP